MTTEHRFLWIKIMLLALCERFVWNDGVRLAKMNDRASGLCSSSYQNESSKRHFMACWKHTEVHLHQFILNSGSNSQEDTSESPIDTGKDAARMPSFLCEMCYLSRCLCILPLRAWSLIKDISLEYLLLFDRLTENLSVWWHAEASQQELS